ncbi:MAG: FAD-dependent oxidoreductase [Verrucomicrobia bacterium]|nr:FAD-dependent oxidoreductase [Verrucomicrobiota bacterium]
MIEHFPEISVDVAIVGAGFSGTAVAVNLARHAQSPLRIALIERRPEFGRGVAYGTADPQHLMNVPAGKMSLYPDRPEHFVSWLQNRAELWRRLGITEITPDSFLPRLLYGAYLQAQLATIQNTDSYLTLYRGEVTDLVPQKDGSFTLEIDRQSPLIARQVVLALGNFPPGDPPTRARGFHRSPRYLDDPWSEDTQQKLSGPGPVLILGSGLTSLDLVVSLCRSRKRDPIYVISRRGLFPLPHASASNSPYTGFLDPNKLPPGPLPLLRALRQEIIRAAASGIDWRVVLDSLRPHTQAIWRNWSVEEKRRFIRHLRAFWEPHRHRVDPRVLAIKEEMERANRLMCFRGRVVEITERASSLTVKFRSPGTTREQSLEAVYVVNCTGPECNYHKLKDSLVVQLFARGIIHPDPLFLGLEAGSGGAIQSVGGQRIPNLYTLGSPQKGMLYETTAVPEIRTQAKELALQLIRNAKPQEAPAVAGSYVI